MRTRTAVVSAGLAFVLLASPSIAVAHGLADAADSAGAAELVVIDRADFYEPLEDEDDLVETLAVSRDLVQVTDEMKYFTKYESHSNYRQGFSYYDGFHALGYYQFDRRYSLINFMNYCLSYDAEKYAMLAPVVERAAEVMDGNTVIAEYNEETEEYELTEIGQLTQDAWYAAHDADPTEFALLQDNFAYNSYYAVTERYLESLGISMDGRADCVKGLVWSVTNLAGTSGVRWFIDAAGLRADMSDREFAAAMSFAVYNNIDERYASQPQYHQGWISRYRRERADCMRMLPEEPAKSFVDVSSDAWYASSVDWAVRQGVMGGYSDGSGRFGPLDQLTRSQLAQILWRYAGGPDLPSSGAASLPGDCIAGSWYDQSVTWALTWGVYSGYDDGTFGPDHSLTREQLAVVLWRIAGKPSGSGSLSAFSDGDETSDYAREAMEWAVGKGIIKGTGGMLAPGGTVDRAMAAAIVMRWTNNI